MVPTAIIFWTNIVPLFWIMNLACFGDETSAKTSLEKLDSRVVQPENSTNLPSNLPCDHFKKPGAEIDAFVHVNKDRTPTEFGAFLKFDENQESTDRVCFEFLNFRSEHRFCFVKCSFGEDSFKHGFVVWAIGNEITYEYFVINQLNDTFTTTTDVTLINN